MPPRSLLAALVLLLALPAAAVTILQGDLDGPTVGTDSPAVGEATLELSDDQTEVVYHITYGNLVGEEIAAHLHSAPPGSLGPIVFELPPGTPKDGTWAIPPQRVASLLDGHVYVVIHSDAHPAGEIGGWVSVTSSPTAARTWSRIRTLFAEGAE